MERGPDDGTEPSSVVEPLRSVKMKPIKRYSHLLEQLTAQVFKEPEGENSVMEENNEEWKRVILPFLVESFQKITYDDCCSNFCLDEEGDRDYRDYQFLDNCRFKLKNCAHTSLHV